jgi:tetratricopeptide (TPR) repeat protein
VGRFNHIDDGAEGGREREEPYGVQHFMGLADLALSRGRFEQALRYFGRALELDRQQAGAWAGQARALLEMDQPGEAFIWLEQAVRVVGERSELHALRAIACAHQGMADDALAWADKALRMGPDEATTWLSRAEVLYQQGQPRPAGRCLDKAHEREPGPETARRCGEIALGVGDLARARTWLERARSREPECPLVALRMGVYWERAGHEDRARVELARALELEPGLAPAKLALADLEDRGFWARAGAALRRWKHAG